MIFSLLLLLIAVGEVRTTNWSLTNLIREHQSIEDDFVILDSPDSPSVRKSDRSAVYKDVALFETPSDQFEDDLDEAINDDDHRASSRSKNQLDEQPLDLTDGSLEEALEDAVRDDSYVPRSLEHSLSDDFEHLSLSDDHDSRQSNSFTLERVLPGYLPPGLIKQNYSQSEQTKLIQLYQSDRAEDTSELFRYLARHIHSRYANCLTNLGKWLRNPQADEPVFYRNCIPCTNAVDLNLQNLFDNAIHAEQLEHYFVNTCDMQKQWISYVSDMEYLSSDRQADVPASFTDIVQQNLLPNQRYVLQGIVRSNRGMDQQGFFHVCNLINDQHGHGWIIDGQIERLFDLNQTDDIKELNQRYRPDYVARAYTGLFRP